LVLASRDETAELSPHVQGLVPAETASPDAISIYVLGLLRRTTASWGMHQDEVTRLSDVCQYLLSLRRWLWWFTIGDGLQQLPTGEARAIVDAFLKMLATMQKQEGLPQYYVVVWHGSKGLHANIICLANRRILDALRKSARFGQYLYLEWIYDIHGLAGYLSEEMTPQADFAFGRRLCRKPGSHQLPGGGDRVRLSSALKTDAIEARYVTPWKRTNAKRKPPEARKPRKDYRPRQTKSNEAPSRPSLAS